MTRAVYLTGTDTGAGKSHAAASLLAALHARGQRALGMKPVASGSDPTPLGLRNADAELLLAHSTGTAHYAEVNPYAFADPIAPHLAAADAGVVIELARIQAAFAALSARADVVVVEGVGGWMAPLGPNLMQADVVRALQLPVILVVGLRLGCLNHTLLSARAIAADNAPLIGWIGSAVDAHMARVEDNIATLRERLGAPCLGILPYSDRPDPSAHAVRLATACAQLHA